MIGCGFDSPYMTSANDRMETFDTWNAAGKPPKGELVKAGFYFTGEQDLVTCPWCGTSVKHWEPSDDPLSEHARLQRGRCPFVRAAYTGLREHLPHKRGAGREHLPAEGSLAKVRRKMGCVNQGFDSGKPTQQEINSFPSAWKGPFTLEGTHDSSPVKTTQFFGGTHESSPVKTTQFFGGTHESSPVKTTQFIGGTLF